MPLWVVWYSPTGTPNLQALDRGGESLTNTLIASFIITPFIISEFVSGFEEGRGYRRLRVFFLSVRLLGIFCPAVYLLYPRAVIRLTAPPVRACIWVKLRAFNKLQITQ